MEVVALLEGDIVTANLILILFNILLSNILRIFHILIDDFEWRISQEGL